MKYGIVKEIEKLGLNKIKQMEVEYVVLVVYVWL